LQVEGLTAEDDTINVSGSSASSSSSTSASSDSPTAGGSGCAARVGASGCSGNTLSFPATLVDLLAPRDGVTVWFIPSAFKSPVHRLTHSPSRPCRARRRALLQRRCISLLHDHRHANLLALPTICHGMNPTRRERLDIPNPAQHELCYIAAERGPCTAFLSLQPDAPPSARNQRARRPRRPQPNPHLRSQYTLPPAQGLRLVLRDAHRDRLWPLRTPDGLTHPARASKTRARRR
jgi:hypothetical protein